MAPGRLALFGADRLGHAPVGPPGRRPVESPLPGGVTHWAGGDPRPRPRSPVQRAGCRRPASVSGCPGSWDLLEGGQQGGEPIAGLAACAVLLRMAAPQSLRLGSGGSADVVAPDQRVWRYDRAVVAA